MYMYRLYNIYICTYLLCNIHIDTRGTNAADEMSSLSWNSDIKWATRSLQPWPQVDGILEKVRPANYKLVYKPI